MAGRQAKRRHRGATGRDGASPHFDHVTEVTALAGAAGGSDGLIAAAYLHDVVGHTGATLGDVADRFGPVVAVIVEQVTNPAIHPETGGPVGWLEQKQIGLAVIADAARRMTPAMASPLSGEERIR